LTAEARQLWRFEVSDSKAVLSAEVKAAPAEPLPAKWAAKDWRTLWQRKLNLAWLPADQVFLRVVQLPASEFAELVAMIELQLEKLSPLPVAQIVWTVEVLPQPGTNLQTAIVVIAPRNLVEEFLGRLEGQGYLADRLELPLLHQLLATKVEGDGVWIYPGSFTSQNCCLLAWWSEGTLQNVNLLRISTSESWGAILRDQLTQIAWAGELEGWLRTNPRCYLVAEPTVAAVWERVISQWSGQSIQVVPPLAPAALAAFLVQRIARQESQANLVPAEFAARYRQQFVDRLWMRGLAALVALYLVYLAGHFGWTGVRVVQRNLVQSQVAKISANYANAMQLKARVQVLQEQVNLKFAALDCWLAAAKELPADLTLTDLSLQQGRTLTLRGTVPVDMISQVGDYNEALRKATVGSTNGPLLFSAMQEPNIPSTITGQRLKTWNFNCELRRTEIQ
jgi:hypothetical protein